MSSLLKVLGFIPSAMEAKRVSSMSVSRLFLFFTKTALFAYRVKPEEDIRTSKKAIVVA